MSRKNIFIWVFLILTLFVLPFKAASAQDSLYIEAVYPEQGSPGEIIDMLVRGAGFESRQELNSILLNGQPAPVLNWAILSDDAVKVQFFIPEDAEVRDTEIRFIFDDIALDAYFVVREKREGPFVDEFFPQEGQIDTQVPLSFAVRDYYLGAFGGIVIDNEEIPVLDYSSSNSTEAWEFLTYLPTYVPPGDGEIKLYFQTYTYSSYFFVSDAPIGQPLSPEIYDYAPNEARRDSEVEFILQGYGFPELGDLQAITLGNFDLPIDYYEIISNEAAAAGTFIPPDVPVGENRIVFTFENYRYTDTFYIAEQEVNVAAPTLFSLRPQKATPDSNITLQLEGENLDQLGELIGVRLGQFSIRDIDYDFESPEEVSVDIYLPENTPLGDQTITVSFENAEIRESFNITKGIDWDIWLVILAIIAGIGAIGVVFGGGYAVAKAIRRDPREKPQKPLADLHFNVRVDPGIQTIEPVDDSLVDEP